MNLNRFSNQNRHALLLSKPYHSLERNVAVDKIPMDCNLIRNGSAENQLSKKTR